MDAVSVLGLLFAAIAASASVTAVWLTIAYAHEQNMRRLAEALVAVRRAANDVRSAGGTGRSQALDDALEEVQPAVAVPIGSVADLGGWLDRLLDPAAAKDAFQTACDADDAYKRLRESRPRSQRLLRRR
jgi:hypothetical protein